MEKFFSQRKSFTYLYKGRIEENRRFCVFWNFSDISRLYINIFIRIIRTNAIFKIDFWLCSHIFRQLCFTKYHSELSPVSCCSRCRNCYNMTRILAKFLSAIFRHAANIDIASALSRAPRRYYVLFSRLRKMKFLCCVGCARVSP